MSKTILVTGATGKQGGSTIAALLALPQAADYNILAVTRNPTSASAAKLLARAPALKLIQGDLNDVPALFTAARAISPDIWGVFSVQQAMGGGATPASEETQGKALIDASLKNNVRFFVYASVDRGGAKSYDNPTNVPHFQSKHAIEHHLVDRALGSEMEWFVLRPTAFFDNLTPDFPGKGFATSWKVALAQTPLQLIATSDIGHFAAAAFAAPSTHAGQFLSLAGDDLTFADAARVFKEKTGSELPTTFEFVAHGFLWAVKEMGLMMAWFEEEGYGADVGALRARHPGLLDFGGWLERESRFEMK